jgi:HlyD family secretion protein
MTLPSETVNHMNKFKGKNKYILIIATIGLVAIAIVLIGKNGQSKEETVAVKTGSIEETARVSGIVRPVNSAALALEKSGTIAQVRKKTGDKVSAGELILSLQNGTELAALQSAEAELMSQKARYDELSRGARPEEILIKESELRKARQDLNGAYQNTPAVISDAYNKADSAINRQIDRLFSNSRTANPDLTFLVSNQQFRNDTISGKILLNDTLEKFREINDIIGRISTETDKETALAKTADHLRSIQSFLTVVSATLDTAINLQEDSLSLYKDSVSSARNNVNASLQNVLAHAEAIAGHKINVERIERELTLSKTGSRAEILTQQESTIKMAEAGVRNAQAALQKTLIRSPINGVVSKVDAKQGEIASPNQILVWVISDGNFNIEADIPEADLPKISVGNEALVTFDSFSSKEPLTATVTSIDPAETVIDGVSTYKTTFSLEKPDKSVRSGMNATLVVKSNEIKNALILPQRALTTSNGQRTVLLQTATGTTPRIITTGKRGSDGMIEIISGLEEGDVVVIPKR